MRRHTTAAAATIALVLVISTCACAQYRSPESSPLGFAISWYRPGDSDLRKIRSGWLGATLQYHFRRDQIGRPTGIAAIEWFSADVAGTSGSMLPLRATFIKRFDESEKCWFVSGGAGIYILRHRSWEYDPKTHTSHWTSDGSTKLGYTISVGRELGNGLYLELGYHGIAKLTREIAGKTNFSGWTLTFGTRLAY
ncbi:MAG: hypothetical protein ACUVRS_06580 [Armatimonadota bacterium]